MYNNNKTVLSLNWVKNILSTHTLSLSYTPTHPLSLSHWPSIKVCLLQATQLGWLRSLDGHGLANISGSSDAPFGCCGHPKAGQNTQQLELDPFFPDPIPQWENPGLHVQICWWKSCRSPLCVQYQGVGTWYCCQATSISTHCYQGKSYSRS